MSERWLPGPIRAVAEDAELHVWRAELDRVEAPPEGQLPADDRRRAEWMLVEPGRRRWVAARWALRRTLCRYLDVAAEELKLEVGENGKPRIAGPTSVRFNLSHSEELALIAVTAAGEVGIDIERVDPDRDFLELARHGLDRESAGFVRSAPAADRPGAFYRAWVRREAIGKCTGAGLTRAASGKQLWVREIDVGEGWAAAIALAGPGSLPLRLFAA